MQKSFLLTFDLEEFDAPIEFGAEINRNKIFSTSYRGCKKILKILDNYDVKATFFTTTKLAKEYPALIRKIVNKGHEVGSHGYEHNDDFSGMNRNELYDYLKKSKLELERIIKTKIIGFRHPRLKGPPLDTLKKLKFKYDSSLHPTYVPTRYNNFLRNINCHKINGIMEVPISVTPLLRLPFSWLWFRNFGVRYAKMCTTLSTLNNSFINLYFHPWELINLREYDIPSVIKRNTGENMEQMLEEYIEWCISNGFKFYTIKKFLNL